MMHQHRITAFVTRSRALQRVLCLVLASAIGLIFACAKPQFSHAETPNATVSVAEKNVVSITLIEATPVVTSTSGYHVKATVNNNTANVLPAGSLSIATNVYYPFVSRTDIQEWSQGDVRIPVPDKLGDSNVPTIAAGGSATLIVDIPASQSTLANLRNWGPKPLLITYEQGGKILASAHTFLTRSSDGLNTADTPALNITLVMPLSSNTWQLNNQSLTSMMTDDNLNNTSAKPESIVTLGDENQKFPRATENLINEHPSLQVVADPTYLRSITMPPKVNGIMQPANFDVTQYSALNDPEAFVSAGVAQDQWNATSSLTNYQAAVGDTSAKLPSYAWQGLGNWTLAALNQAKRQGYETVIADSSFNDVNAATVHTGKYVVPTDSGNITVLAAQPQLTGLASGQATSKTADSETSAAGRLSRFMAQSAFYQMEQPYTARNVLVCLQPDGNTEATDTLLTAIEQASWLHTTSLDTLASAEPYLSGEEAKSAVPQSSGLRYQDTNALSSALQALASSRNDIIRFSSSILDSTNERNESSSSPDKDVQSLARQDANHNVGKDGQAATQWITLLLNAHDILALHGACSLSAVSNLMVSGATELSAALLGGVSITPSENVTVVSETAQLPVTVSNKHPYPVYVRVSSITDSMEIVTSRIAQVLVPAHGEAQVTFDIRVIASGTADAHLTLVDRDGHAFSSPQNTAITSVLRISDKSGLAIIAFALALGALGLWRQIRRKKEHNE